MKKIISILLLCSMVSVLGACSQGAKETTQTSETTTAKETTQEETTEGTTESIVGGWEFVPEDGVCYLSEQQTEIMDKAKDGYTGLNITPIAVVATQVGAGTNYAYLCKTSRVVPEATEKYSIVCVYEDTENNCEIRYVKDIDVAELNNAQEAKVPAKEEGAWEAVTEDFEPDLNGGIKPFNKAADGFMGVAYTPYICLASQLVAGTNYAYLCKAAISAQEPVTYLCVVFVYEDLEGNASIFHTAYFDPADSRLR